MLGYVRCKAEEMLVKHHALYKALYCGLCSSAKKNTTRFLLPFLSYDFVFLATLRLLVSGEEISFEKKRCLFHPFQRKKRVKDNKALAFSSAAMLFLTYEKMRDDLIDKDLPFSRRLIFSFYVPILRRSQLKLVKKDPSLSHLAFEISDLMEEGRKKEKNCADLDEMCSFFADCLSRIFSFGYDGEIKRILSAIGDKLGRLLYTLDALDDLEKDEKSGAFNPILNRHGSLEKAKEHFPEHDLVLSFYIQEMKLALDLLEGDRDLYKLCDHIICTGLPDCVKNILKSKTENENERPL